MNISLISPNAFILYKFGNAIYPQNQYKPMPGDSFELSFGCKGPQINLRKALNISGIHCPGCGIQMLSEGDYNKLIERAGNIETAKEFVELLKEYRKFIPNHVKKILSETDNPEDYEKLSITDYYFQHRREAYLRRRDRVRSAREYLRNYSANVTEDERPKFLERVNDIHSWESYKIYKQKVEDLVKDLPQKEQNLLKKNTLKDVASSSNYYYIFQIDELDNLSQSGIAKVLVQRIFKNSLFDEVAIIRYDNSTEHQYNRILLCNNCEINSSKHVFWKSDMNHRMKENIIRYLSDIANLMGQNKIEDDPKYLSGCAKITGIFSHNKINMTDTDIERILNLRQAVTRHEEFAPIAQAKIDIPCADCGSTMLPHSVRNLIEEELYECSSLDEYAQVLKKYDKYIGKHARPFADIFFEILSRNSEISMDDFVKEFRKKSDSYSKHGLRYALFKYEQTRDYVYENRNLYELNLFDKVDCIVKKYISQGKFNDFHYTNFFQSCFNDIDLKKCPKSIGVLLNNIREICYRNQLTRSGGINDINDTDAVHTILFNLFKADVATADHLIAAVNGGKRTTNNLIGLCKACNVLKSRKSVNAWYSMDLGVRKFMPEQVKIIDKMAKDGIITGYDDWAADIAQTMYEETHHAFNLADRIKE